MVEIRIFSAFAFTSFMCMYATATVSLSAIQANA